ncbi:MAG TPA: hypothetical protein VMR28_01295 [Candidatus Saccharimonadales bacterium]|nr:hypothetical protein [Candidatus Saccharimonadales bacterium]
MAALTTNYPVSSEYQALLQGVAEELKLPLLSVARRAELALITKDTTEKSLRDICMTANGALELIDGYLLGLQLAERQHALELEPVSVTSILYDVAHTLTSTSERYNLTLELDIRGTIAPVMSNRSALMAALLSLGTAFIEAQEASVHSRRPVVTFAAYRTRSGLAAGIYSNYSTISSAQLRRAYMLHSFRARQPLTQLSATSAAGLFVARQILRAMSADLKVARHHKQAGLATILQPSRQLQFV